MKKNNGSRHLGRHIALAALLALLCIGGVELAACRHFAPATYDRIVAPARYAAAVIADTGKAALNAAGEFCLEVGRFCQSVGAGIAEQAGRAADAWAEFTAPREIVQAPGRTPPSTEGPQSQPPATAPPITEVLEVDGHQILTGGSMDIVYFCQSDEEWAEQLYGTDPIGPYGCGPTVMAMAIATMTDTDTDPAAMAAWAADHGHWARRSGSYDSIVTGTAQAFGLEAESLTQRTVDEMLRALWDGKLLVAHVGPGHFTEAGHFILIRGATLSGEVLVADPNSLERSLQLWDPQIILDELSSARSNGAPLWALSTPDTYT
ncbi:MAG: C39 family peptidase [Oscillospiraceae bacterium]|nr:C39 family peptidase [Oscillospiraceae bacterium]